MKSTSLSLFPVIVFCLLAALVSTSAATRMAKDMTQESLDHVQEFSSDPGTVWRALTNLYPNDENSAILVKDETLGILSWSERIIDPEANSKKKKKKKKISSKELNAMSETERIRTFEIMEIGHDGRIITSISVQVAGESTVVRINRIYQGRQAGRMAHSRGLWEKRCFSQIEELLSEQS